MKPRDLRGLDRDVPRPPVMEQLVLAKAFAPFRVPLSLIVLEVPMILSPIFVGGQLPPCSNKLGQQESPHCPRSLGPHYLIVRQV